MYSDPLKELKNASVKAVEICKSCNKPKSSLADQLESGPLTLVAEGERCVCAGTVTNAEAEPSEIVGPFETELQTADSALPDLGDRYEVLELIGRGGMGAVYKAIDRSLNKVFAVKVLNPGLAHDRVAVKRFELEAAAAKNLTHANLAAVYDFGVGRSGSPFLVMDFLEGQTLEQVLEKEGFLEQSRALDIFIQAAEAVADSHLKSVIHRDIKPSNIILEQAENGSDYVKIVDFGIAKVLPSASEAQANLTQTGDIFGSPLYMSPEQCQGNMQDRRSDIYSLGCVMYEAVTGIQPFAAENPIRTILKHINEDPRPISTLHRHLRVSTDLDKVIMHCLARDPSQRYQSADELVRDLKRVRDGEKLNLKQSLKPRNVGSEADAAASRKTMKIFVFTAAVAVMAMSGLLAMVVVNNNASPPVVGSDPYSDAQSLDSKAFYYFNSGQYDKAAPLLEFGTKVYRDKMAENLRLHNDFGFRTERKNLAENFQHIGKCYMMMARGATAAGKADEKLDLLKKAKAAYGEALPFYRQYGNYNGGQFVEFVTNYSEVLQNLHLDAELQDLRQLAKSNGVTI